MKKNNFKQNLGVTLFLGIILLFVGIGVYVGYLLHHLFLHLVTYFTLGDLIGCYILPTFILGYIGFYVSLAICEKFKFKI